MENKTYLISILTAATITGYALGEFDGFSAKAAQAVKHSAVVRMELGSSANTTLNAFLQNQLCAATASQFGIEQNECSAQTFRTNGVMLSWTGDTNDDGTPDGWEIASNIVIDGSWVAGSPE